MKESYFRLKLTWLDDCRRVGEFILLVALAVTLLVALFKRFDNWSWIWILGALYLYSRPKNRGFDCARTAQYRGYRFKVWQGYGGRWFWRSVKWPFLEQGWDENEPATRRDALETIDAAIAANFLEYRDGSSSEIELKKQKVFEAFRSWVKESELDWSPRIKELTDELDHWRNGDDRLHKEAMAYYEHRRRMREEA